MITGITEMVYELFHKDIMVLSANYDPDAGKFGSIIRIYNEEHIPVGLDGIKNYDFNKALQFWWESRIIPKNRSHYKNHMLEMNVLLANSCGSNLSDQFWIRPEKSDIKWKDCNFFTNEFNEDIGKYLLGKKTGPLAKMDSNTPDLFSNGEQDKRWVTERGVRKLIKYGRPPYYEQPFNEMLAAEICRRLGFPHVKYSFVVKVSDDMQFYSSCPCFVTEDTEFVPAGFIQYAVKRGRGVSSYDHLLKCCSALGMKDLGKIEEGLLHMVLLDFITANEDRHFGNFGFIRNATTLQWEGLAPNFDAGNAMFYEYPTSDLRKSLSFMDNVKCKTFAATQKKQLGKFTDKIAGLNIDFSKLDGIEKYYRDILSQNPKVDEERRELLSKLLVERIQSAEAMVYSRNGITSAFLNDIASASEKDYLMRIKNAMLKYQKMGSLENSIVSNYLRSLNAKNPQDLVNRIKKALVVQR